MTHTAIEHGTVQNPFLTKYAVARTPSPKMQGYYSPEVGVWVVNENGIEKPLIDCVRDAVELVTKTFAQEERDDDSIFSSMAQLEMVTTSKVQAERDDISCDMTGFLLQ